jgi:hypothetical protein
LAELKTRGLGKLAPEIDGIDRDGRGMRLSQCRGKVGLLSFWPTWWALAWRSFRMRSRSWTVSETNRLSRFGVNGDIEAEPLRKEMEKYKIT